MPQRTFPKVSIVGTGRVGTSLGRALHEKGYPIASLINRTGATALALAKLVKCRSVSTQIADISPASEVIILAVSDEALRGCVSDLLRLRTIQWKRLFVAHVSGVHTSRVLLPLEKKGATVASMHPIQTFPRTKTRSEVRNICFGVEGSPAGRSMAERIVHNLGSRTITVTEELKPLYHAACVFASGHLIVMLNAISQLSRLLGVIPPWTEVFGPLMTSAMENAIRLSPVSALTGPIVRKDLATVGRHVKALAEQAPQILPLYLVAGVETARMLHEHGTLSTAEFQDTVRQLKNSISLIPTHRQVKGKK